MSRTAAIVGGGVIGGGWAARFLLNGWNVRLHDPAPETGRRITGVLDNARNALPGLFAAPMPEEGRLSFHDTVAGAVSGADWVQESVPERIDLKRRVLAEIATALEPQAVVGSSTSGFKPSELQECAERPGQLVVAHPFNPVYLLPLVELVTTDANPGETIEQAQQVITEIGMYPLHLTREVDAHIADRFLEAVWREALWLIRDGIATTQEIDDAIRYGFGLRWAQMGLFDTYRLAGGEAGMRHFMAQFGPCLALPWTRLTDVPELSEELVDLIAGQSDAQSGHMSIRDLERTRDRNLVAILRALKGQGYAAGKLLRDRDTAMLRNSELGRPLHARDLAKPLLTLDRAVPVDWIDYNGHMTESRYLDAFAQSTDRFMELVGCDATYISAGGSYFTVETHIRHLNEAHAGDRITVRTEMLLGTDRKLHLYHTMHSGNLILATGEHFLLHVSLATRKPCQAGPEVGSVIAGIAKAREGLPLPKGAGAFIRRPR